MYGDAEVALKMRVHRADEPEAGIPLGLPAIRPVTFFHRGSLDHS